MNNEKVFLGGTCNNSKWREIFLQHTQSPELYFNPVVKNWNREVEGKIQLTKYQLPFHVYVITPLQKGFISFFEILISKIQNKDVYVCFAPYDDIDTNLPTRISGDKTYWTDSEYESIKVSIDLLKKNGIEVVLFRENYSTTFKDLISSIEEKINYLEAKETVEKKVQLPLKPEYVQLTIESIKPNDLFQDRLAVVTELDDRLRLEFDTKFEYSKRNVFEKEDFIEHILISDKEIDYFKKSYNIKKFPFEIYDENILRDIFEFMRS